MVKLRWWLYNQIKIKKTDLRTFPTAEVIFRDAYASILPAGAMVDKATSCASAPLQSVLDRTVGRSEPGQRKCNL